MAAEVPLADVAAGGHPGLRDPRWASVPLPTRKARDGLNLDGGRGDFRPVIRFGGGVVSECRGVHGEGLVPLCAASRINLNGVADALSSIQGGHRVECSHGWTFGAKLRDSTQRG